MSRKRKIKSKPKLHLTYS